MSYEREEDVRAAAADSPEDVGMLRGLISGLVGRSILSNWAGITFKGKRDLFRALGYSRKITADQYHYRFERGGIAARIVEARPFATWREGAELIEDEDPDSMTAFEEAWDELNKRLKIWSVLQRADILARLGRYSVVFIGGPGADLSQPFARLNPAAIQYLQPYPERDARIESLEENPASKRFGRPTMYVFDRMTANLEGKTPMSKLVHWTRVLHFPSDTPLDNNIYGPPALERVWNDLDDLDKVRGGGSEAYWKRVDGGKHIKADPTLKFEDGDKEKLQEQLDEYNHGLRRELFTRGVDISDLGSNVAMFGPNVDSLIGLIAAATATPQRILMGSERGELASSQDRDEWSERIHDRRTAFAGPLVVRPFVDHLIELGALPAPKTGDYEVRWPAMKSLDDLQKVDVAVKLADVNQKQGEIVITTNEIRDRYLDLPPIEEVLSPEELALRNAPPPSPIIAPVPGQPGDQTPPPAVPEKTPTNARQRAAKWAVLSAEERKTYLDRVAAKKGKEKPWAHVHRSADRFRQGSRETGQASVRGRKEGY